MIPTSKLRNQLGVLFLLSVIGGLEAHGTVEFEGRFAYQIDGNDVTLEAERLVNRSSTRTTGTLYLTLWMTTGSDPYTTGHRAASVSLGTTLRPGYVLEDISRDTTYSRPPPGTYYVHLYVSEYPKLDTTLDLVTFTRRLAVPDDHGDTPAAATLVAIPSSTPGEIEASGDRDVFRIDVQEAGTLRVDTRGDTDTHGSLSRSDGQVVATNDDGGTNLNFLIMAAVVPGPWYVEVRGYAGFTTGGYTLDVTFDPQPPSLPQRTRRLGDFDGDGHDDVLLRRDDGAWYYYAMDGRRHISGRNGPATLTRDLRYDVAGIGDFDGDGRDDVLLRRDDGAWYYYAMDGRRHISGRNGPATLTRDLRYGVAGIGDLDGDGRDDVLLRRDDGAWYYYAMDGRRHISGRNGPATLTRDLRYDVAGIGDFDGDGRDDVLLRRDDGFWYYYAMDGRRHIRARTGPATLTRNLRYGVAGIGDLDGDGRDDVLLRRDDGAWYYYAMDGRRHISGRNGPATLTRDLRYGVAGIGDLDGDGRDDVLLRRDDGFWYYYAMDGRRHFRARTGPATLTRNLRYGVAGTGDLDVDEEALGLLYVKPTFGLPGTVVTLSVRGAGPGTTVQLRGQTITPDSIAPDKVTFTVPEDARTGPLQIQRGDTGSNAVIFTVSDDGLISPAADEVVIDESGLRVVVGYLVVTMKPDLSSPEIADELAAMVSGEVVGKVDDLRWWQISVSAATIDELKSHAVTIEADSRVESTAIDVILEDEAIDWRDDPDVGDSKDNDDQRGRNNVEEGAMLYESLVSPTATGKKRPFFISMGVAESGVDFALEDLDVYDKGGISGSTAVYATDEEATESSHGSNVVGVIGGTLGDGGAAGIVRALGESHGGANISVSGKSVASNLAVSLQMAENGTSVINWSWGLTRRGTLDCSGIPFTGRGKILEDRFNSYRGMLTAFFDALQESHPMTVVVTSAGNARIGASSEDYLQAVEHDQLILVGAHGSHPPDDQETNRSSCSDTPTTTSGVVRATYSNYGSRVDISASGTINGASGSRTRGTSYTAPLVSSTIALMQSINPNLTPAKIKALLRRSALPIDNNTVKTTTTNDVFTRPLTSEESEEYSGKGARLNVEGAIRAAVDSLDSETLPISDPLTVEIGSSSDEVTEVVSVTVPALGPVFNSVDIMFVVDVSSSYSDDIVQFRRKAADLISSFRSSGADVFTGVASFSDFPQYPYGGSGDYAFRLDQALGSDTDAVVEALDRLEILNGADGPESQLEALFGVSKSPTGWRPGSLPVVFLATDAKFHNSDVETSYPGAGYSETLSSLKDRGIRVYGLQSGGTISDVVDISADTGGEAFELSRDSSEVVDAVQSALDAAGRNLTVNLVPHGDFAGLVKSVIPSGVIGASDGDAIKNVNPGDTVDFDVIFNRSWLPPGKKHTFSFRLRVVAAGVAVIQEVPVTVIIE